MNVTLRTLHLSSSSSSHSINKFCHFFKTPLHSYSYLHNLSPPNSSFIHLPKNIGNTLHQFHSFYLNPPAGFHQKFWSFTSKISILKMGGYHDSQVVELTGNILIVSIVALSVIVIFVFLVHLYAKCFWYRRDQHLNSRRPHRHRRGDFTPAGHIEHQPGVTVLRRGLNPSFLKTIPVIHFDPKHFAEGLECTVCLSELVQGAKARILPKCNHGFHVECIDMWFYSHSTCPICRDPVSDESQISVENLLESRQPQEPSSLTDGVVDYFPTNILFWGDETEVSTLTSQLEEASNNSHHHHQPSSMLTDETPPPSSSQINNNRARTDLVIHIPRHIDDHDDDVDDQKSPVSSRIGSLRRILSGSRRFINPF